ncbi:tRNA nucleotidyltransferase [Porphyromonas macacae]|uniref:tRNA nucleotidyltransferase n=1 Tax=Porphyromonas macacae TaxID=28115 RepID=A0A0A2E482_9PORP|nr:HD domain-containing protein [Porphyromonas macacae]KGN73681.1 tRNA nucleotidyltransferase [Porphyromonas macacae]
MTDEELILSRIDNKILRLVSESADEIGVEAYVVGGYVRDIFLRRPSDDIDIVSVGKGIDLAQAVAGKLGKAARLSVFKRFGTAQVKYHKMELEFVGARRESYSSDSRKPVVEDGTLQDDLERRDFTINALAVCLNGSRFGELIDMFDGLPDMDDQLLRTPLDPEITFSDDPLRMMRAIRFASQLAFTLDDEVFEAIKTNAHRIDIVSAERIIAELNKIMLSPRPSIGLELFEKTGLMARILPELLELKGAETKEGIGHKDNLTHTYKVVDNLAKTLLQRERQEKDLYLLWGALLHDIGKPRTKKFDRNLGWTFHNHNYVGMRMVSKIFRRIKMPLDQKMHYVEKLVELHMRPAALVDEGVTDSAVRRLLFEAGDDIDDLMLLVEADITSKNPDKVRRYLDNYAIVRQKLKEIEEKDRIRNFQPPIMGEQIMKTFNLPPCEEVGRIKDAIKDAILDGIIPNEYEAAYEYMLKKAASLGLKPIKP